MQDKNPKLQTIKLGVFFLMLFTSYSSFQTIVTHIYELQGLTAMGPLNLIVNYSAFVISNIFAPYCKIAFKYQMLIGALAYCVNLSTGIYVPYIQNDIQKYIIVAFGAAIGGLSAGFLWVSQGGYLRQLCKGKNDKGKYSGIFQMIYCVANAAAGFITTFGLGFFSNRAYFISITLLALASALFCCLFLKDFRQSKQEQKIDHMKSCSKIIKFYPKMIPVLLVLVLDGISLGFFSNQVVKLMPQQGSRQQLNKKAGIIVIIMGTGTILGGYVSGIISDKIKLRKSGYLLILFYLLSCGLTFIASQISSYPFVCVLALSWGFSLYYLQGWMSVVILKIYGGSLQAFGVNKQLHCVFFCLFQGYVLETKNKINLNVFLPIVALISVPCILLMQKLDYHLQNKKAPEQQTSLLLSDTINNQNTQKPKKLKKKTKKKSNKGDTNTTKLQKEKQPQI